MFARFSFFSAVAVLSVLSSPSWAAEQSVPGVAPKEAAQLVAAKKAVLVDVREVQEAAEGMAEPAALMPLPLIEAKGPEFQEFLKGLSKETTTVLYCRRGRRSGIAAKILAEMGYKVANMGGYKDWEAAKLPSRKYDASKDKIGFKK